MAYKGGNIDFTIKGDEAFNLDELDFRIIVYPDRHYDATVSLDKSELTKIESNVYSGTIGYDKTKQMPIGMYTVEVLIIESETSRSIYAKQGAFPLYASASEDIE